MAKILITAGPDSSPIPPVLWRCSGMEQADNKKTYMREFRARRLAAGLCTRCGKNPHLPGKQTCGCDLKYQQKRAARLAQAGVCRRCSDPVLDGLQLCESCREQDSSRKTERSTVRHAKGLCASCGKAPHLPGQKWCRDCCDKAREYAAKVRLEVFQNYGGPVCACCGETEQDFLTIDHINGGGTKHRNSIGMGRSIYPWLKAKGYPEGYQVLCFNCNCGRKTNGVCPHKRKVDP